MRNECEKSARGANREQNKDVFIKLLTTSPCNHLLNTLHNRRNIVLDGGNIRLISSMIGNQRRMRNECQKSKRNVRLGYRHFEQTAVNSCPRNELQNTVHDEENIIVLNADDGSQQLSSKIKWNTSWNERVKVNKTREMGTNEPVKRSISWLLMIVVNKSVEKSCPVVFMLIDDLSFLPTIRVSGRSKIKRTSSIFTMSSGPIRCSVVTSDTYFLNCTNFSSKSARSRWRIMVFARIDSPLRLMNLQH